MVEKSIVVNRKKFFGDVFTVEVESVNRKDIKEIKINKLQTIKQINESICKNIYEEFVKCSNNLSETENELKELLNK